MHGVKHSSQVETKRTDVSFGLWTRFGFSLWRKTARDCDCAAFLALREGDLAKRLALLDDRGRSQKCELPACGNEHLLGNRQLPKHT